MPAGLGHAPAHRYNAPVRIVHLYPFVPRGRHGGTLRLRAALAGSAGSGEPELHWFDPASRRWHGAHDQSALDEIDWGGSPEIDPSQSWSLKRFLFPSTLWGSGRRPRRALSDPLAGIELHGDAIFFLHTTYLAPLIDTLPVAAERIVLDVYDLVWKAHQNDARAAAPLVRSLRRAYAATVRERDHRVRPGEDLALVTGLGVDARWIPTPTPVEPVPPRDVAGDRLRVGLIGNFAHVSTRQGAEALLRSDLARDPGVTVVLAGLGSAALGLNGAGVELLGPIERAEDFYARVDCVVAPVLGGSGIKVKLGEALCAGRPVVTTAMGAAGYPPPIRRHFALCDHRRLDRGTVERTLAEFDPEAARADAGRELGWDVVVSRYRETLAWVAGLTPARR